MLQGSPSAGRPEAGLDRGDSRSIHSSSGPTTVCVFMWSWDVRRLCDCVFLLGARAQELNSICMCVCMYVCIDFVSECMITYSKYMC